MGRPLSGTSYFESCKNLKTVRKYYSRFIILSAGIVVDVAGRHLLTHRMSGRVFEPGHQGENIVPSSDALHPKAHGCSHDRPLQGERVLPERLCALHL